MTPPTYSRKLVFILELHVSLPIPVPVFITSFSTQPSYCFLGPKTVDVEPILAADMTTDIDDQTIITVILLIEFVFFAVTFATATPRAVARCGLIIDPFLFALSTTRAQHSLIQHIFYSLNQLPAVLCLAICGGIPAVFFIRNTSSRRLTLLCLGILSVAIWYAAYVFNALSWEKSGYFCLSEIAANS